MVKIKHKCEEDFNGFCYYCGKNIIKKEKHPIFVVHCGICDNHKKLYGVGKEGEQTEICLECLKKEGTIQ